MDQNVSRIVSGTIFGVQPSHKRRSGEGRNGQQPFSMEHSDSGSSPPPDAVREHEILPVSKASEEEAGGRLDLTA